MTPTHDEQTHSDPIMAEKPLDAANQSLADALRSSFGVLKAIMVVLMVLYLVSNVRRIEPHEEALVLRLGKLQRVVHQPGLIWAFPFPIDEIVPLPTRKSNELTVRSHTFFRNQNERGKPLSFISRGLKEGLNPARDFALLTADAGLVHAQWKVTYKFDDLDAFVRNIAGDKIEAAQELIKMYVEAVGVEVATEMTAEEMVRTKIDRVQSEMKLRINERLAAVKSGIVVTLVEMFEPTPPIAVVDAFNGTQRAENAKQQMIRAAEKDRTRILSEAAGAAYPRLIRLLDRIDATPPADPSMTGLRAELDRMLKEDVEGEAGRRIKEAGTFRASLVSQMQSDVDRYRALLPEYRRNPLVLINRLWEATKLRVFSNPGVTKFYRIPGLKEFRIQIPLDPDASRQVDMARVIDGRSRIDKLIQSEIVPVGPEYD